MKKKIFLIFFVLSLSILIFGAMSVSAAYETYEEYTYIVSDGYITITQCDRTVSGDITIPSKIRNRKVTQIGSLAFANCDNLTSVSIPDSITSIGDHAFLSCDELISINIPNSVTSIGEMAFYECGRLENVIIPDSVKRIGQGVFWGTALYGNENNWDSGVLYVSNHLIEAKDSIFDGYKIKEGTVSVAEYAFADCSNLTSITMPDSINNIGFCAFRDCNSLAEIDISDSVTSISGYTFYKCNSLTNIVIPKSVTNIGRCAFYGCNSLKSIRMTKRVAEIEHDAFSACYNLETVYFNGTEAEWNAILIGAYNTPLVNAAKEFLSSVRTKTDISEDKKTITVTNIPVNNGYIVVLALYSGEQVVEVQSLPCTVAEIPFTTEKSYDGAKVMIWESLKIIRPIYNAEIVK